MALGNGLAVTNDWGNDGRLASRRLYRSAGNTSLSYLAYRYDGNDNITAIVDQLGPGGSLVYGYDKLDRLSFTLINSSSPAGTATYSTTTGTNRLASVTDSTGARTIAYDARGNTASEVRPGGITATAAYDGYGRLTGYNRTGSGNLTFAYNGLDDRVKMTLPNGTRRFVYDPQGRVMGEYGASATDVKAEFIWLSPEVGGAGAFGGDDGLGGYMPLAVATPNAGGTIQVNWVYGNHLGVPLLTTDAAGNPATTPNDYLAPGFPGQSRVLADLYYNRYRDYDPSTGRYIQADPIGLAGGSNPYGYAGGNPVSRIDPNGLVFCWLYDLLGMVRCEDEPEGADFGGGGASGSWSPTPARTPGVQPSRQRFPVVPNVVPRDRRTTPRVHRPPHKSPIISPSDVRHKTRDEIRCLANELGLIPRGDQRLPDYPRKWVDPVTGIPRLRLDRGHIDDDTGLPYDIPNAARDHAPIMLTLMT